MKIINSIIPFILKKKFFRGKRVALCSVSYYRDGPAPVILFILYDVDSGGRSITISEIKVLGSSCDKDKEGGDKIRDIRDTFVSLYYSSFCSKFISSFVEYFMCEGFEVYVSRWIREWFSIKIEIANSI